MATPTVFVVGAGPAGLMLAVLLTRFGINVEVIDERADQTQAGRADGLQPKTIETLRQLRLADGLLQKGAKVFDICFWEATANRRLRRLGREIHYPALVVDLLDDYILLVHQGVVEGVFLEDLRKRGVEVKRSHQFQNFKRQQEGEADLLEIEMATVGTGEKETALTKYIVGCDGARSKVRNCIPDTYSVGKSHESVWAVLDGELISDFPDLWSKTVVYSEVHGSILIVPRERGTTRFYVEIKPDTETSNLRELGQEFVMQRARQILAPYSVEWRTVEWFGNYQIGQRIANKFTDPNLQAFIAGDASHTHSPKAAQGMNTSMHDSWNLAWKLNLSTRGLAKPVLLESYELERRKIAHDLINFDYEHANKMAGGDAKALAENFRTNVRFISGVGVEYDHNVLNHPAKRAGGELRPGCLVPPAKVTRYIDANPIDVQLDIPMLGQFRVYFFVPDIHNSMPFLQTFCNGVTKQDSLFRKLSQAAAASYIEKPRVFTGEDVYVRSERYTGVSELTTFSLITTMDKARVEIQDLPPLFARSAWTFYLDNVPYLDTRRQTCTSKWVGTLQKDEVAVVILRPDGYVGSISRWDSLGVSAGTTAADWLNSYYDGFLKVPEDKSK
ncbi:FAD binding domain-containing protein [Durotheca rogersii]|uniref:FAD binding domain-containing protein n=1 Tax=Durotheca rogersii TaxID=419775 RepID=UPI00221E9ADF|nr:FAD binding domain-containing protein [Durotheca rogersii]KAI5861558.1 FAD binding domain-containing protein [Durotheca rogersii]